MSFRILDVSLNSDFHCVVHLPKKCSTLSPWWRKTVICVHRFLPITQKVSILVFPDKHHMLLLPITTWQDAAKNNHCFKMGFCSNKFSNCQPYNDIKLQITPESSSFADPHYGFQIKGAVSYKQSLIAAPYCVKLRCRHLIQAHTVRKNVKVTRL